MEDMNTRRCATVGPSLKIAEICTKCRYNMLFTSFCYWAVLWSCGSVFDSKEKLCFYVGIGKLHRWLAKVRSH